MRKNIPIEQLEAEFEKIEKLGYLVSMSNDACQIYINKPPLPLKMVIDSDFKDNFYENAVSAIHCFWNEYSANT